jgi:hypothetical protein
MTLGEHVVAEFTPVARRLGLFSGGVTVVLIVAYAITLAVGLWSLKTPQQPIADPMLWILEVLIIVMMPAMVSLMVAVLLVVIFYRTVPNDGLTRRCS